MTLSTVIPSLPGGVRQTTDWPIWTCIPHQRVPGHSGELNEAADSLANQAAATGTQEDVPLDLMVTRTALNSVYRDWTKSDSQRHPHPKSTPGHDQLPRKEQVIVSQLGVERSSLTQSKLHRIGRATRSL